MAKIQLKHKSKYLRLRVSSISKTEEHCLLVLYQCMQLFIFFMFSAVIGYVAVVRPTETKAWAKTARFSIHRIDATVLDIMVFTKILCSENSECMQFFVVYSL